VNVELTPSGRLVDRLIRIDG